MEVQSLSKGRNGIDQSERDGVHLPDFREKCIRRVVKLIESDNFVQRNKVDGESNAFSRNRKLTFIHLIVFITQSLSRSIQRELNSFYQKIKDTDFSIQEVTKSAFTHARKKLKPDAFKELNREMLTGFYEEAPYRTWKDYRLLSIDASALVLPKHKTIVKEFGSAGFGPLGGKERSLAKISMCYDVLNFITLDADIQSFNASERAMALKHLDCDCLIPGKDLVIMDRGYPSIPLMYEMQQRGIDYCIRMVDNRWNQIKKMVASGKTDEILTFTSRESGYIEVTCRVVVLTLPDGGREVLATSITDKAKLPYEDFAELYHYRWNIEEGYKLYKSRLQLEAFSGKTALAVKQDFFAKVFIMTTTAVLAFPLEEQLKKEEAQDKKLTYKINKTNALSLVKEMSVKIWLKNLWKGAMKTFDSILKSTLEAVRPNRKNPRKKLKKKPPSMGYKQL